MYTHATTLLLLTFMHSEKESDNNTIQFSAPENQVSIHNAGSNSCKADELNETKIDHVHSANTLPPLLYPQGPLCVGRSSNQIHRMKRSAPVCKITWPAREARSRTDS
jgi:hypothetical protein